MSPIHDRALEVADAVLRRQRGLHRLSTQERLEVEALATAVALRVADTLERLDAYAVPRPHRSTAA